MADRYRAPGGWTVEVVHLTGTPDHHDGEWFRVSQYGAWTADVRTVGELAQYIELADLEPELALIFIWSTNLESRHAPFARGCVDPA
jgi:hypothetical protein